MYVYALLWKSLYIWILLCGRVHMYVGNRGRLQVVFLKRHSSSFLRLTVLELAKKTKLAASESQGPPVFTLPALRSRAHTIPPVWVSNVDPHACIESTV